MMRLSRSSEGECVHAESESDMPYEDGPASVSHTLSLNSRHTYVSTLDRQV